MKRIILISLLISILFLSGCEGLVTAQNFERRKAYIHSHQEVPTEIKTNISRGFIIRGMDREQVIASWGRPYKINRSVGSWGVHEQWSYVYWGYYGWEPHHYLYFENGILDSWQDL